VRPARDTNVPTGRDDLRTTLGGVGVTDSFVRPPALSLGDTVAVVAPSSGGAGFAPHVRDLGVERLRETFGLDPVVYPTATKDDDDLKSNPEARAADVHDAFRDPDVRAVVATIGGDDQIRVLRHLDPDVLRSNPTRFYGMSDNTNLALFLWNRGVVSFYGGQLMNQLATPDHLPAYTERYVRRAFFEESLGDLDAAAEWADYDVDWSDPEYKTQSNEFHESEGWRWAGGDEAVAGRVWGGCLTVLDWQLATNRYLPDPERLDGRVLVIETAEEMPAADQVRRMLMCMGERGLLERFAAVLVGRPATASHLARLDADERGQYRADQRAAILGQLERYNPDAPVVFDLDFGHTNPTAPIPIGGRVRVDPGERSITFPG